jgi:hypothetical protein
MKARFVYTVTAMASGCRLPVVRCKRGEAAATVRRNRKHALDFRTSLAHWLEDLVAPSRVRRKQFNKCGQSRRWRYVPLASDWTAPGRKDSDTLLHTHMLKGMPGMRVAP